MLKLVLAATVLSSMTGSFNAKENQLTSTIKDNQCPPWNYYDASHEQCKCYNDVKFGASSYAVRCNKEQSILYFDHCMTYDEESGTSLLSYCLSQHWDLSYISVSNF